jgi:hypothetical protein
MREVPYIAGILSIYGSLFGEGSTPVFNQGEKIPTNLYPPAYSAPANISLASPAVGLFVDASFLYYYIVEEGFDIAASATMAQQPNFSYSQVIDSYGTILFQPAKFHPAFQVGIGYHHDDWEIRAEYTRITAHSSLHSTPPPATFGIPVWSMQNWFQSLSSSGIALAASEVTSKLKLSLNMGDITLSRPLYESPCIILNPFGGVRTLFITQSLNISIVENEFTVGALPPQPIQSHNSSHSWGLGPIFGITGSWFLPKHFRLEGMISESLLFTRVTSVKHEENAGSADQTPPVIHSFIRNADASRPILEMSVGFGWGSYLNSKKNYLDFVASYDFLLFNGTNVMRKMMDGFLDQATTSSSDLHMSGLSIKARFDF